MASRTRKIYIDSVNRKAYSSFLSRITLQMVDFHVADEEILQLINCQPNPDPTSPLLFINNPVTGVLYAALGIAGQVATSGAFLLTDPVATQTVAQIPFNVTPSAFQASLRAGMVTHYASCIVTQNGPGDYYVDRVTIGPIASTLTGDGTDLFPACFVNIIPVRVGVAASGSNPGTSDVFRIILNTQPAAYLQGALGSPWTALPAAAVTVQPLVTGSTMPPVNAVFRVSINPDTYQGSFYITATNLGSGNTDTATSSAIQFDTTDVDMQAQIIAGWGSGNEVTVNQVNGYTWDVTYTGANLLAKPLAAFTGDASGLSVPVGLQGLFDLRTEAANSMLTGGASRSVYFQVKNTDAGGIPQTWLYTNCTLQPTLISPEVLGSSNIPFPLTEDEADIRYLQLHTPGTSASAGTVATLNSDTDGTMAANSDTRIATQKAIVTYVGARLPAATLVKTADFTMVNLGRYQVDIGGGSVIAQTPATPSPGFRVEVQDATESWGDGNTFTIHYNGTDKINGGTADYVADGVNGKLDIDYISAGYGWSIK